MICIFINKIYGRGKSVTVSIFMEGTFIIVEGIAEGEEPGSLIVCWNWPCIGTSKEAKDQCTNATFSNTTKIALSSQIIIKSTQIYRIHEVIIIRGLFYPQKNIKIKLISIKYSLEIKKERRKINND